MSDTTLEWRNTGRSTRKAYALGGRIRETPVPQRKYLNSEYAVSSEDYRNVAYVKSTRALLGSGVLVSPGLVVTSRHVLGSSDIDPQHKVDLSQKSHGTEGEFPAFLILGFTLGVVTFLSGAFVLLLTFFWNVDALWVIGAFLLALGSFIVVMALLWGQDFEEKSG